MLFPVPFLYTNSDLILISSKLKDTFFSNSSSVASFESKTNCSSTSGLKPLVGSV